MFIKKLKTRVQLRCEFCSSAITTKEMPEAEPFPALSQPPMFPQAWGRALVLPPLPPAAVWSCACSYSLSLGCTLLQHFLLRGTVWVN